MLAQMFQKQISLWPTVEKLSLLIGVKMVSYLVMELSSIKFMLIMVLKDKVLILFYNNMLMQMMISSLLISLMIVSG